MSGQPLVERKGDVAWLVLAGGELGLQAAAALERAATVLRDDDDLRVVVVDHEQASFCSGPAADLVLGRQTVDPAAALAALQMPIVAAARGAVASVGLELMLAADIRVAAPDTEWSLADVAGGTLPCWGGTQRLPRIVGRSCAAQMLLLGRRLTATEALGAGLIHELADDPSARAGSIADALAALGPLALVYAKEAVVSGSELPLREGLRLEADLNTLLQVSADRAEGLQAFFDKRAARFHGR